MLYELYILIDTFQAEMKLIHFINKNIHLAKSHTTSFVHSAKPLLCHIPLASFSQSFSYLLYPMWAAALKIMENILGPGR